MAALRAMLIASVLAAGLVTPALACSPPPPPPLPPTPPAGTSEADVRGLGDAWNQAHWSLQAEQERARSMKQQASLFDAAGGMMLARLDRLGRTSGYPDQFSHMNNMPLVVMKPMRWVKGAGASDEFQLVESSGMMTCGYGPADAALRGKQGDVFLVYLEGGETQQNKVLFTLPVSKVIEPRTLAALTEQ